MKQQRLAALYDALYDFESRYRRGPAYPVHKRLQFPDPAMSDIYDWIIAEVGLPQSGAILDAGCGTGFGSLRLALASQCDVTGISISEKEILAANRAAAQSPDSRRLAFLRQDFNDVPTAAFDLIVAVESLKHCHDLAETLSTLRKALRPGGKLVIVEDCYSGLTDDHRAITLTETWQLAGLFGEAEYVHELGPGHCRIVDLGAYLLPQTPRRRWQRGALRGALLTFGWTMPFEARQAMRGGLALQQLYDAGLMSYRALIA